MLRNTKPWRATRKTKVSTLLSGERSLDSFLFRPRLRVSPPFKSLARAWQMLFTSSHGRRKPQSESGDHTFTPIALLCCIPSHSWCCLIANRNLASDNRLWPRYTRLSRSHTPFQRWQDVESGDYLRRHKGSESWLPFLSQIRRRPRAPGVQPCRPVCKESAYSLMDRAHGVLSCDVAENGLTGRSRDFIG